MRPIIRVEGLSKRYRIQPPDHRRVNYRTLREDLRDFVAKPFVRLSARWRDLKDHPRTSLDAHIWALKNINFTVEPGEVLGLIGRNGAGKSTLLKILSRITEPTAGRVELYGRVGSLLEIGTGFHPELTGRENIFLSGAIMGMRRSEISRKFEEMVGFAELEDFIDTPVKFYSSGMYVRLAFAVAAHLEPEILLIDEVLAVGDAAFQKRCLGKMGDVAREGRTILFVSHNLASIEALCRSCLLINRGELEAQGAPSAIISRYMTPAADGETGRQSLLNHPARTRNSLPIMTSVELLDDTGSRVAGLQSREGLVVAVRFMSSSPLRPILGVTIKTAQGMPIFGVSNRWTRQGFDGPQLSCGTISCDFERIPLMPGVYSIDLYFGDFADITRDLDLVLDPISFEIYPTDLYGTGLLPRPSDGPVIWNATWRVARE